MCVFVVLSEYTPFNLKKKKKKRVPTLCKPLRKNRRRRSPRRKSAGVLNLQTSPRNPSGTTPTNTLATSQIWSLPLLRLCLTFLCKPPYLPPSKQCALRGPLSSPSCPRLPRSLESQTLNARPAPVPPSPLPLPHNALAPPLHRRSSLVPLPKLRPIPQRPRTSLSLQ